MKEVDETGNGGVRWKGVRRRQGGEGRQRKKTTGNRARSRRRKGCKKRETRRRWKGEEVDETEGLEE